MRVCVCVCVCVYGDVSREVCWRDILKKQVVEFHQTLVDDSDDVAEATDELIRFWRSLVQGHGRVF